MSAGVKAGSAFVDIAPNVSKFGEALGAGTAGPLAALQEKVSGLFSALGPAGAAVGGVVAGGAAIGGVLFGIGEQGEKAYNKLRITTGATGADMDKLKDSFNNVLKAGTAGSFDQITSAMGGLNVKLGASGKLLEDLTREMVALGRIQNTDVGETTKVTTDLINKWGISAGDTGRELDVLFKASQVGGGHVTELAAELVAAQPALKGLGLGVNESAAMFATFEKNGINAQKVSVGLNKAFVEFTKEGLNTDQARAKLFGLFDDIRTGKGGVETTAEAIKIFGARSGNELVQALKSGKGEFGDTLKAITDGKGGIMETAAAVSSISGKLAVLKNMVKGVFMPIGIELHDFVNEKLGELIKILPTVGKAFSNIADAVFPKLEAAITPVVDAVRTYLVGAFRDAVRITEDYVIPAVKKIAEIVFPMFRTEIDKVRETFEKYRPQIEDLVDKLKTVGKFIAEALVPVLAVFSAFILGSVLVAIGALIAAIGGMIQFVGQTIQVFEALYRFFTQMLPRAWDSVTSGLSGVVDKIGSFISGLPQKFYDLGVDIVKGLANGIRSMASTVIDAVKHTITDPLPSFAKKALGVTSPSRVFMEIGANVSEGMALGITTSASNVHSAVNGMVSGMLTGAARTASGASRPRGTAGTSVVVNAGPNMDEERLGRIVAAEVDWRQRTAAR